MIEGIKKGRSDVAIMQECIGRRMRITIGKTD